MTKPRPFSKSMIKNAALVAKEIGVAVILRPSGEVVIVDKSGDSDKNDPDGVAVEMQGYL